MGPSLSRLAPRRVVGVVLAFTLVGAAAGIAVADSADPGPFVGCLASKTTTGGTSTSKGQVYNVGKDKISGSFKTEWCETKTMGGEEQQGCEK